MNKNVNTTSAETYNFSNIKVEEQVKWLQPGRYLLGINKAEYIKPDGTKQDGTKKTPLLKVTFQGEDGMIDVNMYVTPKAFQRFQYLYTNWFEKECTTDFSNEKNPTDAVGMFFEKAFNSTTAKKIKKNIIVGGRASTTGKMFAELPFINFIIQEGETFTYGPFAPGSADYIIYCKPAPITPASHTDNAMLSEVPFAIEETSTDDLPF